MPTYYAISTTATPPQGVSVYGIGSSEDEALLEARKNLAAAPFQETAVALLRNLTVVTRRQAIQRGLIRSDTYFQFFPEIRRYLPV